MPAILAPRRRVIAGTGDIDQQMEIPGHLQSAPAVATSCALTGFAQERLLGRLWPHPFWRQADAERAQRQLGAIQAGEQLAL